MSKRIQVKVECPAELMEWWKKIGAEGNQITIATLVFDDEEGTVSIQAQHFEGDRTSARVATRIRECISEGERMEKNEMIREKLDSL